MNTLMVAKRNGSGPIRSTNKLQVSVQTFFEAFNWDGIVPTYQPSAPPSQDQRPGGLTLTLKVSQFFDRIPWDGIPVIAAPVAPLEVQPEPVDNDNLTLEGFSDLFD